MITLFSRCMNLFKRCFLVVLTLFILTGCTVKIAYNFLDWLMYWYVDDYVTLDRDQTQHTKQAIDEFHAWHRRTQLPKYADYIDGVIVRLRNDTIDSEWIHDEIDRVQLLVDESLDYLIPATADIAETLTDDQVQELMESFAEEREEFKEEYIDVDMEKRYDERADKLEDNFKKFTGRLNDEQEAWIVAWSQELIPYESLLLKQREIWANDVKAAMDARKDRESLERELRRLMFYRTDNWDKELQRRLDKNQEITYDVMARVVNNLTEKQRDKMFRKLQNFAEDFRELSRTDKKD